MSLVPASLLRRVGSCSGAEDSVVVMERATHVHAQRRHFGHEKCVFHGILTAVLGRFATSVRDKSPLTPLRKDGFSVLHSACERQQRYHDTRIYKVVLNHDGLQDKLFMIQC